MAADKPYVIFVGSADIDEVYEAASWAAAGGKCNARYLETIAGGMIANAACVCAGYGVKTYCFDSNGADAQYDFLFEDLERNHVDTSMMVRMEGVRETKCLVFRLPDGERSIVCVNSNKQPLELSAEQREFFMNSSAVYGSLWMGHTINGAKELLAELKAKGVKIMFDAEPNSWKPDWEDYFASASFVSMNEYAIEKFRGDMPVDEFCKKVFDLGVEAIILTLGKDGCRLLTKEDDIYIPAFEIKVADTTGCGDTFNSTFLASVLTGKSLPEAAKYANAAANMAATVLGPRGGITTFDKVDKFLADHE